MLSLVLCVVLISFLNLVQGQAPPTEPFNTTYWFDYRTYTNNPSAYTGALPSIVTWNPSIAQGSGVSISSYSLVLNDPIGSDLQTPTVSGTTLSWSGTLDPQLTSPPSAQGLYSCQLYSTDSNSQPSATYLSSFLTYSGVPTTVGFAFNFQVSSIINNDLWAGEMSWTSGTGTDPSTNAFGESTNYHVQFFDVSDDGFFSPFVDVWLWNTTQPAYLTLRASGLYLVIVQGVTVNGSVIATQGSQVNLDLVSSFNV